MRIAIVTARVAVGTDDDEPLLLAAFLTPDDEVRLPAGDGDLAGARFAAAIIACE